MAINPSLPAAEPLKRVETARPRLRLFLVGGTEASAFTLPPDLAQTYDLALAQVESATEAVTGDERNAHPGDLTILLYGSYDLARRLEALVEPVLAGRGEIAFAPRALGSKNLRSLALSLAFWPLREHFNPRHQSFALKDEALGRLDLPAAGASLALAILVQGSALKAIAAQIPPEAEPASARPASWHGVASEIRRAAELSGALISYGTAARFSAVGLIAMAVDLTIFKSLLLAHFGLSAAHITSFVVSALINFQLNARWTFKKAGRREGGARIRQYLRFFAIALMALTLRGGFLGLATDLFGLPPLIGILFGIAAAAGVTFLGNAFFVFPTREIRTALPWRIGAVGALAFSLLLRLVYIGQAPLLPEEAYYWEYARHLALGYLDHPPMVAWTTALSTFLLGTNEFALRLPALCAGGLTMLATYFYARDLYGKSAALVSVLLLASLPYFFGAALILSPDAYLTAAWAGALLFLERALLKEQRSAWIGAGLCLGLGMLSKYTIALLGPAALLFVLIEPRSRRWLARPEPYLGVLLAALLFAPVVIWNAEHHWASFVFQGSRRMEEAFSFGLPALILDILALLTPFGAAAAVLSFVRPGKTGEAATRRRRFEAVLVLVPLAVFFAFSLTHEVKPNWTGPLWLALLPAIANQVLPRENQPAAGFSRALRLSWKPLLAALFILYGGMFHYMTLGLPGIGYSKSLHGLPVSWPSVVREVTADGAALAREGHGEPLYVGLDKYDFASEIAFYARREGKDVTVAGAGLFGANGLMYDYWRDAGTPIGRTLVLLGFHARDLEIPAIARHCTRLGPVSQHRARRHGKSAGRYFQRLCFGYRRAPAAGLSQPRG